ncbi:MAG TPA: thiamine pyrophosphate-binding protein [Bryobacteraceae bacterium]|nr:thiamine pyrophosphate-binding protein [Bryobacteraceae bacterium]
MTAVECFVNGLRERGVEWMATLCGHGLDPLFHAASRAGIRLIDTRNEQTAAYAAEAWGRLTRRPGVCAVSSGVAHANALTGVVNAWFDGSPLLLITGAGALATSGLGHFQDIDQVAMARPVTHYSRVIDRPERALQILDEAWHIAASAPGPVHLTFPMDIQRAEVAEIVRPLPAAAPAGLAHENADVSRCERPLLIAGSGVYYAGAGEELMRFSEEYAVPVVVPIWDRGVIDRPIPTFMGVVGAASGGPRLLADADCILLAGASIDYRLGFLQPDAIAPGAQVVRGWRGLRGLQPSTAWLAEARRRRDQFRQSVEHTAASQATVSQQVGGLHARDLIAALRQVLRDDSLLLIDGGSIGQWAHQLLCDRYPGHWLTCGRSGVVGWGIGGAIGARMAWPGRPILLLSGDGSFTFTVSELECAVRQRLPFVAVVADDQGWGITRAGHLRQFGEAISSSLGPIAFDRLADSLGARGLAVTRAEDLAPAITQALSQPAVTVIHVPIVGGNP